MLAFRSLDPFRPRPAPDRRRRDEERLSRSEQRTLSKNPKQPLDRKSPIQVRIHFPPPVSLLRTWPLGRIPSMTVGLLILPLRLQRAALGASPPTGPNPAFNSKGEY